MNYKAPFLRYDRIRPVAEEFLVKYHPKMTVPLPIEEIIEFDLKIDIVPFPNLQKDYSVEGWLSNDMKTIYVDEGVMDKFENRYRFTLAHELGHRILHEDFYSQTSFNNVAEWISVQDSIDSDQYSWFETQAYDFAGLILVPPSFLLQEYAQAIAMLESQSYQFKKANFEMINGYISKVIAKVFAVSEDIALRRIRKDDLTPNAI